MDFKAIIEELGIDKLTPEEQKTAFESIFRNLNYRIGRRLGEQLSEEEVKEFQDLFQQSGDPGVLAELERRYPNLDQIFQEELNAIKESVKAILPT